MRAHLAARNWGPWLLEQDKLCRQVVATFVAAIAADPVCLMTDAQLLADDDTDPRPQEPLEVMPWLGESRKGPRGSLWVAPHVVSMLAGVLLQHGCVPKSAVHTLQQELDPRKGRKLVWALGTLVGLCALMWIILIIDTISGAEFRYDLAITPRKAKGLVGVFFTWLCHKDFEHLIGNTFGFLTFGAVIMVNFGLRLFLYLFAALNLAVGLTWLGRGGCGASGVVFGLFGFVLMIGVFKVLGVPPCRQLFHCPPRCCGCMGRWCNPKRWLFSWSACQDIIMAGTLFAIYSTFIFGIFPSD